MKFTEKEYEDMRIDFINKGYRHNQAEEITKYIMKKISQKNGQKNIIYS